MGVFYIFLFPLVLIIFIKKYAFVPLVKCSKMACLWDFLKIPTKGKVIVLRTGYKCDITRDENNNLVISNSDSNIYRILKEQLRKAYKLQLEFHNSDETGNYTSDAETMVEAYSTLYVIMNKVVGSSYDKVVPENITDVLEVCKSVATVIGFYHKKGYLHLDIKPDNIYVLKETNQIINLFDFDTVKLKSDLENV